MRKLLTALALTIGLVHQATAANLLTNGSFESPDVGFGFAFDIPLQGYGINYITGWTVTQGSVDLTGVNGIPAQSGNQAVDLTGDSQFTSGVYGGLTQTFATAVGQVYNLSFWYTHNFGASASSFTASAVLSNPNGTLFSTIVSHNTPASIAAPGWTLFSDNFVANTLLTTLTFTNLTGASNGGIYLDNVSVQAVAAVGETPIPSALPLFATGLSALGLLTLRRKRRAISA